MGDYIFKTNRQIAVRINDFISYHQEKGLPCFIIFELETNAFIGRAGFGPLETGEIEVGYVSHKKFWGKGYASEILMQLLVWAKDNIPADYIIAYCLVGNIGSWRVMEKCGMKYVKNDTAKGFECKFYKKELK